MCCTSTSNLGISEYLILFIINLIYLVHHYSECYPSSANKMPYRFVDIFLINVKTFNGKYINSKMIGLLPKSFLDIFRGIL